MERGRFAPTPSGPAHPGTLLAALLCWLDARSRDGQVLLRLEDVDASRCTSEHSDEMRAALAWLGLDWDGEQVQSSRSAAYTDALDRLATAGRLYPCRCSRAEVRRSGRTAVDGGALYPGTCRERELPRGGWRTSSDAIRFRLPDERVEPRDEGGLDLAQRPMDAMGDPVLRNREGQFAYHLAAVVDDADQGVTRVVRGRDLAPSTAIHVCLQQALGLPTPVYRHHLLLLEQRGAKLAKLHGAVGWREIARHQSAGELCGFLAAAAGLLPEAEPTTLRDLLRRFDWQRVTRDDRLVLWNGRTLSSDPSAA